MGIPRVDWTARHDAWLGFVEGLASFIRSAAGLPLGPTEYRLPAQERKRPDRRRFTILMCSPHPDDEALVGAFSLRALKESNAQVVNCAITLGSDKKRRRARLK